MRLDRETEALLHWASSAPATPLWCLSPEEARNEYRRMLLKTEIAPPVIGEMSDLAVPGPDGPMRLRRYAPAKAGSTGGARSCSFMAAAASSATSRVTTSSAARCATTPPRRCSRSTIASRLSTNFLPRWRTASLHIEWLIHEATALGLDQERIAIAGDSAGGGLAAVALHETKGRLAAPVRAQVLIYPALDLRGRLPSRKDLADHFLLPQDMIQWFFGHYFGLAWPIADPRAIPALYEDYTGLPPALIVTAGHDPLRDEGAEYADTLAAAGVPVDYECCEGTIHGFMNMGRVLRKAHGHTRRRLAAWLRAKLHG